MEGLEGILEAARERRRRVLPPPKVRRTLRVMAGLRLADVGGLVGAPAGVVSTWEAGSEPGPKYASAYHALLQRLAREIAQEEVAR